MRQVAAAIAKRGPGVDGPFDNAVAFVDMEASGLGPGTWPIEAGWAIGADAPQSFLIRPCKTWSMDAWDPKAEALHGLSPALLVREGLGAKAACSRLNKALGGRKVYSDAPDHDGWWLHRLFTAAGAKMAFQLLYLGDLIAPFIAVDDTPGLLAEAERRAPHTHRAAADVRHMQEIYRLAAARGGDPVE